MDSHDHLLALEKKLHSVGVRSSAAEIGELLAEGFFEFGASGRVWTRQDILQRLPQEDALTRIESSDYKATPLAPDVVLVTYLSTRVTAGEPSPRFLRSSVWRREDERWVMAFHQGTPAAQGS